MKKGDKPILTAETTVKSSFKMDDVVKAFVDMYADEQAYFINKVGDAMLNGWGRDFMQNQALAIGKELSEAGKELLKTILYEE